MRASALTPAAAGQSVAQWCVASGRERATVAVSGASTLSGALTDFWAVTRAFAEGEGVVGRQRAVAFPFLPALADEGLFKSLVQHIDECSGMCEYVGQSMLVAGRHPATCADGEPQAALLRTSHRGGEQAAGSGEPSGAGEDDGGESDSSIDCEHVVCSKCGDGEPGEDNDILLCDLAGCGRAYHQRCLVPAVATADIPPGDENWFCHLCSSRLDCLEMINDDFGTDWVSADAGT